MHSGDFLLAVSDRRGTFSCSYFYGDPVMLEFIFGILTYYLLRFYITGIWSIRFLWL